jgi:5-methylcytosine-specific restriction protein A
MGNLPYSKNRKAQRSYPKSDERYHTSRWRKVRAIHLEKQPCCTECERQHRITPGQVVDHIIPVRQGADFWDDLNYQTLCNQCHQIKRAQEKRTTVY